MNKHKEIIKEIDSNPRLSIEQDEILNSFFEYLENNDSKKIIVGIKGVKGDGKTRLLNSIVYLYKHLTGDKENIKFDSNNQIAFNSKIIIIDDFDSYNEDKQKKLINKNMDKVILISYSIIENLYIKPNKEYSLNHKYRLKYLNISDSNVISVLRDIEDYSFRTLMTLKDNLDSDIRSSGKINVKDPWLFFQKKFECLYKKEWSNIKKIVINSSETFPKVNEEGSNNLLLKKYHEEYGWLYKENNSFVFYNDEVLVLLLIRQGKFIENIKKAEILPTLCKKYFKFRLFQKSLIKLLISQKIEKTNLIKNEKIYLTSLLDINDINWVNLENIIFNLDSVYDIFHLLKNRKLLNIISLKEIYDNSFRIIKSWKFSDADMLYMKNEFKNIYKLIILSFQIINYDGDLRLINHINWKKVYRELISSYETTPMELRGFSLFYVLFLMRIISQKNGIVDLSSEVKEIKAAISVMFKFSLNYLNLFIQDLLESKLSDIDRLVDIFLYFYDKSNLLVDTSLRLSALSSNFEINSDIYKNQILKQFNSKLLSWTLYLTENRWFERWFEKNIKNIYDSQYGGKWLKNIEKIYFEELNPIYIIKNAILLLPGDDYLINSRKFGKIFPKKVIHNEPKKWKELKKNFDINDESILLDILNELIVKENDIIFFPIYIDIKYSKKNKNSKNLFDHYFGTNIYLVSKKDDDKIGFDQSEYPFKNNLNNSKKYMINSWKNSNDSGYVILCSNKNIFKGEYIISISNNNSIANWIVIYDEKTKEIKLTLMVND